VKQLARNLALTATRKGKWATEPSDGGPVSIQNNYYAKICSEKDLELSPAMFAQVNQKPLSNINLKQNLGER